MCLRSCSHQTVSVQFSSRNRAAPAAVHGHESHPTKAASPRDSCGRPDRRCGPTAAAAAAASGCYPPCRNTPAAAQAACPCLARYDSAAGPSHAAARLMAAVRCAAAAAAAAASSNQLSAPVASRQPLWPYKALLLPRHGRSLPLSRPLHQPLPFLLLPRRRRSAIAASACSSPSAPAASAASAALPHELHLQRGLLRVAVLLALLTDAVQAGLQREGPLDPGGEAHCEEGRGGGGMGSDETGPHGHLGGRHQPLAI